MEYRKQNNKKISTVNTDGNNCRRRELGKTLLVAFSSLMFTGIVAYMLPVSNKQAYFVLCLTGLLVAVVLKLITIYRPLLIPKIDVRDRLLKRYGELERNQKLYCNILLCIPLLLYAYIVDPREFFRPLVLLFLVYSIGVAAYDITRIYGKLSACLPGKGLLAIGFAIGSNMAFGLSGEIISGLTKVSATNFPHTLSFLAIGMIPVLFMLLGAIYIPVVIALGPFFWLVTMSSNRYPRLMQWLFAGKNQWPIRRYIFSTLLFQVAFYTFLCTIIPKLLATAFDAYGHNIEAAIRRSIYSFDMYPGTACQVSGDYRIAALGDENYIVAKKNSQGVQFEIPRKCTLKE